MPQGTEQGTENVNLRHGSGKERAAPRSFVLVVAGLLLAGCAGAGGPSGVITGEALEAPAGAEGGEVVAATTANAAVETTAVLPDAASSADAAAPVATATPPVATPAATPAATSAAGERRVTTDGARAAPPPKGREKEKEKPFPTFGAPAKIGDIPVLTKDESSKMQSDLESLAREREAKALRELEADQ